MPSQAQLSRVGVIDNIGKVANKTSLLAEQLKALQATQVPAICCAAWNSMNITVPVGVWTSLTLNTNLYDQFAMHTPGDSEIYCVVPGKYVVTGCVEWTKSVSCANGSGIRLLYNGATVFGMQYYYLADLRALTVSGTIHMSAIDDYVELQAMQNTGAPTDLYAVSGYSPRLGVHKYG